MVKDIIPKIKEQLKTAKGIVFLISIIFILLISFFIGFQYLLVILMVVGFFLLIKQGEKENETLIAPWQIDERKKEIEEFQKRIDIVKNHIKENPIDLDAKLKLKEMEDGIAELKAKYNIS